MAHIYKGIMNCSQYVNTANHGRPLILLKTHVVLVRVACGSNIQRNNHFHNSIAALRILISSSTDYTYRTQSKPPVKILNIYNTFSRSSKHGRLLNLLHWQRDCHSFKDGMRLQHTNKGIRFRTHATSIAGVGQTVCTSFSVLASKDIHHDISECYPSRWLRWHAVRWSS